MIYNQFFVDIAFVLKCAKFFNVSSLRLNRTTQKFHCDDSPKTKRKIHWNFFTMCCYFLGMIIVAFLRYKEHNLDVMNQVLAFQFGTMIMTIVLSSSTFFSDEICTFLNAQMKFLRYLQCKNSRHVINYHFKV